MAYNKDNPKVQLSFVYIPNVDQRRTGLCKKPHYMHNAPVVVNRAAQISRIPHVIIRNEAAATMVSRGRRRRVGRFFSSAVI